MSQASLAHIQRVFGHAQYLFGVDEVAVLLRKSTEEEKDYIRVQMRRGDVPGARKVGKEWKISLDDLAEFLGPTAVTTAPQVLPTIGTGSGRMSRRKSMLGERIGDIRTNGFWSRVAENMGWEQEAQLLDKAVRDMLQALVDEAARAQAARFDSGFAPAASDDKPRGPKIRL